MSGTWEAREGLDVWKVWTGGGYLHAVRWGLLRGPCDWVCLVDGGCGCVSWTLRLGLLHGRLGWV